MFNKKNNRYLLLLVTELLCLILLLPGCFREAELVDAFNGENIADMMTPVSDHLEFFGEKSVLSPGVYEIRVQTRLAAGQTIFVEMKCDDSYFKALRGNGVSVFSGNDEMTFSVWAVDKLPSAYIQCNFYGTGSESLVSLEVYRTNRGNRVLLFLALTIFGVIDALIVFRRRILEGQVTRKQQIVLWTLSAGVLIAYFPYLTDYFSAGADTMFHWTRITGLKETLEQGASLPVRVQSFWNYGHGYAVSIFYGDLFLLIPAGLLLMGFPMLTAYKIFILVLLAATAVISYHSFYRCVKEEYAALFGSMIYLLIPYHILNIYNRGALGECLAMTFLPLVCCGMYLLYTEDVQSVSYKKYKWYIVWGMSAILESHLISTEMTVVFMLVFCVIFWKKTLRRETFLQLLEAAIIALLINMWFWLPMLYMMNADIYHLQSITAEAGQNRGLYFASFLQLLPNKGGYQEGMWNCEPVQIGAGALMLLVIYILWRWRNRLQIKDRFSKIMAIFSILTLVMSTRYLPWDMVMNIPVIGYVVSSLQFPSRWMVLSTLFVALFAAFFFSEMREKGGFLIKAAVGMAAVITVASAVYYVNSIAYETGAVYLYEPKNMGTISVGNGEYLLEEVGDFALDLYYHDPVADAGLEWSDYEKKGTRVSLSVDNTSDGVSFIEIPLMGYKGYSVMALDDGDEGAETPYITEEVGNHGDLRIAVPAGYQGSLLISYQGFPFFRAAETVSWVSLAAVIGMYLYYKGKKIKHGIQIGEK